MASSPVAAVFLVLGIVSSVYWGYALSRVA